VATVGSLSARTVVCLDRPEEPYLSEAPDMNGSGYVATGRSGADGDWSTPTRVRQSSRPTGTEAERLSFRTLGDLGTFQAGPTTRPRERGLPGWAALLLLLVIAGIGGLVDTLTGAHVRGGFNVGIVVASVVAILAVRKSDMFPIVIAPPLVYSAASAAMLYVRSSGLHDRRVMFDAAANWLVYGFPAVACATAAVLIIAGIRMIVGR